MMNSSAIGRENHGTVAKERCNRCVEHVQAACKRAERRKNQRGTIGDEAFSSERAASSGYSCDGMQVTGYFAGSPCRLMTEHDTAPFQTIRADAAQVGGRLRVMISLHPEPFQAGG